MPTVIRVTSLPTCRLCQAKAEAIVRLPTTITVTTAQRDDGYRFKHRPSKLRNDVKSKRFTIDTYRNVYMCLSCSNGVPYGNDNIIGTKTGLVLADPIHTAPRVTYEDQNRYPRTIIG